MDRRHLAYFLAVAECGSISAASRQLGVSQPTVSQAIARAESEYGVPLLRRTSRGVALTDAGRDLVGPAAQVLRGYDELDRALRPALALERGRLHLVCPRTLAHDPLAGLIGAFRRQFPGIFVTLHRPVDAESAATVVASGRAEVGIGATGGRHVDLVTERLGRQRIVALVHPRMKVSPSPDLAELVALGVITTPRGGVTRRLVAERVGDHVLDRATVVETSAVGAVVPLVRGGLGVAFVPEAMGREALLTGVEMRYPRPDLTREIWLVHGRSLSPAAREFVALARRVRDAGQLELGS